ncbi:MAG: iron complex outermembrane receptor protein [Phenylobacterium sp.]|jgi:iron complex outermembrane receptor protein
MKPFKLLVLASLGLSTSISTFAELEIITVTATKREASLQEVPIAVTAMTGDQLKNAGITDVRELATLSPSFNGTSSSSETGGTALRIRGVGTTGNNIGLESAVGVFIDGVYLSRPGIALTDLVDIERIEILRGPQGTLFGRNTSAGALNIMTQKPSLDQSHFWANATIGNFNAVGYQVGGTLPLIDNELGMRFSATKRSQDGFSQSVTSGNDSITRDRYSFKSQLLWAGDENVELRLIGDYSDADEQCCDAAIMTESPLALAGIYALAGLPANGGVEAFGQQAFEDRLTNGDVNYNTSKQFGLSAHLDWDLDWAKFTGAYSRSMSLSNKGALFQFIATIPMR